MKNEDCWPSILIGVLIEALVTKRTLANPLVEVLALLLTKIFLEKRLITRVAGCWQFLNKASLLIERQGIRGICFEHCSKVGDALRILRIYEYTLGTKISPRKVIFCHFAFFYIFTSFSLSILWARAVFFKWPELSFPWVKMLNSYIFSFQGVKCNQEM